jgi:2-dehydro-3-deoxyphosphogalactonate aldolase
MDSEFQQYFRVNGLIGIFRGVRPDAAEAVVGAAIEGGLTIVEIPLNSPQPLRSIEILARRFGDRALVGAGTVTRVEEVRQVAAAGGRLIVTPYARVDVVEKAKELGLVAVPGALTPTEIAALHDCGADAVKIFPADMMAPAVLKSLKAVLPDSLKLLPVGGIGLDNMREYLAAGAAGFGLGSSLYRPGDREIEVLEKARAFVALLGAFKRQGRQKS